MSFLLELLLSMWNDLVVSSVPRATHDNVADVDESISGIDN
jgi:hypothetical protein